MDEAIKRFNLIDILGIFAPGALAALCVNYYWIDLLLPVRKLFGQNTVMLGICFFGLSFLVGSAMHTLGSLLEKLITFCLFSKTKSLHRKYLDIESVRKAYKEVFGEDINNPSPQQEREIGSNISSYIQRKDRPQRIVLFTAYSAMSRTLVAALGIMLVLFRIFDWCNKSPCILCGIGMALFWIRWRHFERLRVAEIYTLFKAKRDSENSKDV